jgi:hypothetical protein
MPRRACLSWPDESASNTSGSGPSPRTWHVISDSGQLYEIRFQAAARRATAQRLPEVVAAAVLEF